jgi:hypothetical protein
MKNPTLNLSLKEKDLNSRFNLSLKLYRLLPLLIGITLLSCGNNTQSATPSEPQPVAIAPIEKITIPKD